MTSTTTPSRPLPQNHNASPPPPQQSASPAANAASPPSRRDLKSWWKRFQLQSRHQENQGKEHLRSLAAHRPLRPHCCLSLSRHDCPLTIAAPTPTPVPSPLLRSPALPCSCGLRVGPIAFAVDLRAYDTVAAPLPSPTTLYGCPRLTLAPQQKRGHKASLASLCDKALLTPMSPSPWWTMTGKATSTVMCPLWWPSVVFSSRRKVSAFQALGFAYMAEHILIPPPLHSYGG